MSSDDDVKVTHDAAAGRFQAVVDGQRCELDYVLQGDVAVMHHTVVPRALEGRGIASRMARVALQHAREAGWRVQPSCSFMAAYMRRHPETQDLLA
ncbi:MULTISPECIES: GNAT family N-acetyltransferase [Aquincola]|uniref:GNAT family N-acetyltransferase n=1 Tax=Aquincola TaxID=391952 RepID=UPI000614E63F|nr:MULTISPECIES: GNAT family N-acetyltransferase [Aquincola]MCR5868414.1 N-acetyltransferase [Aquincola sp. J276]